ncbi:MAG: hypothetical protein V1685_05115 [Parcubacteria group bacterium]
MSKPVFEVYLPARKFVPGRGFVGEIQHPHLPPGEIAREKSGQRPPFADLHFRWAPGDDQLPYRYSGGDPFELPLGVKEEELGDLSWMTFSVSIGLDGIVRDARFLKLWFRFVHQHDKRLLLVRDLDVGDYYFQGWRVIVPAINIFDARRAGRDVERMLKTLNDPDILERLLQLYMSASPAAAEPLFTEADLETCKRIWDGNSSVRRDHPGFMGLRDRLRQAVQASPSL